ncbi:MAG: hypothetical protein HXS52_05795 [Theionarchaea archaeon]|nr:hypothetical protein [Theionarchaea archaeon]
MKKWVVVLLMLLVVPVDAESWQEYESSHFIFNYQEGYLTSDDVARIAENQEAIFSTLVDLLDLKFHGKVVYYLYGNRGDFKSLSQAYYSGGVHILCTTCENLCTKGLNEAHEMTHALSVQLNVQQQRLLSEGLAVYCQNYINQRYNLHSIARTLHEETGLSVKDVLHGFYEYIPSSYFISGSFVTFLLEEYGMASFKDFYGRPLTGDSFVQVYGKQVDTLEEEWLKAIEQTERSQEERDFAQLMIATTGGDDTPFFFGRDYPEYATHPSRAEEIMCIIHDTIKSDREKAFSYANQYRKVMQAWNQGIDIFRKALEEKNLQMKPELFEKAALLYGVAGDEDMKIQARKYAAGYISLAQAQTFLEQKCVPAAEDELEKAKILLKGAGAEEHIGQLDEYLVELKRQNADTLDIFVILFGIVMGGKVLQRIYSRVLK